MKKLVINVAPFTFSQTVMVFENNDIVDTKTIPMNKLDEAILALATQFESYELTLIGAKAYTQGIKKKIEKAELKKYNENLLKITLM